MLGEPAMPDAGYQFAIEFFREDGSPLGQIPVTPDWEPAFEYARFAGIRRGLLPVAVATGRRVIEPIWHRQVGEPYVSGVRAVVRSGGKESDGGEGGGEVASEIPGAYFRGLARTTAAALVQAGALEKGDHFQYLLCAFRTTQAAAAEDAPEAGGFAVEEVVPPLPLEETLLAPFLSDALRCGTEHAEEDMPVFIPHQVLDEAKTLARQAGDVETGGILVGKLHRDREVPEVFLEITAQIPAEHTRPGQTKLTFTAETWTAVRAAIELRKQNEQMAGWWHTHPDFCRKCPPENRKHCQLSSAFFSAEDVHLHRTCFGQAYSVALLISQSSSELTSALFGWRYGMVAVRGFHVTGLPTPAATVAGKPAASAGGEHAPSVTDATG